MGIRIRLSRTHLSRNNASYQIVVSPASIRPTGRPLEILGAYHPIPVLTPPPSLSPNGQRRGAEWGPPQAKKVVSLQECGEKRVVWNTERIKYWLAQGAMPSKRVEKLLVTAGILDTNPLPAPTNAPISRERRIREAVKQASLR